MEEFTTFILRVVLDECAERHRAEDGYSEDSVYLFHHAAVVVYFKGQFCYFVVLFGCETLSLTFREEHWLGVFEGTSLGIYLALESRGYWRKLRNWELNGLYSALNIILVIKSRRMRRAGNVGRMGEGRDAYKVLVGKPEGKKPPRRPRRRREKNSETVLQ